MAIASVVFNPLDGSAALSAASVADSKAVVADSKAVVAGDDASEAKVDASTAVVDASTAKVDASTAKAEADSAIGSEPGAGQYRITDLKRNADGSIVVEYDDSAIDS